MRVNSIKQQRSVSPLISSMPRLSVPPPHISCLATSFTPFCFPTYPSAPFVAYLRSSLMHVYLHVLIPSLPLSPFSFHTLSCCAPSLLTSSLLFSPFISPFICHSRRLLLSRPPSLSPSFLVYEWWVCGVLVIQHLSRHPSAGKPDRQLGRQNDKRRPEGRKRLTARQLLQQD